MRLSVTWGISESQLWNIRNAKSEADNFHPEAREASLSKYIVLILLLVRSLKDISQFGTEYDLFPKLWAPFGYKLYYCTAPNCQGYQNATLFLETPRIVIPQGPRTLNSPDIDCTAQTQHSQLAWGFQSKSFLFGGRRFL